MMTVKQVSDLTGISIRTLQFYDKLGLLSPAERTEAGYRLYDNSSLERLQEILLFRELEFPLKDIKKIISDRKKGIKSCGMNCPGCTGSCHEMEIPERFKAKKENKS